MLKTASAMCSAAPTAITESFTYDSLNRLTSSSINLSPNPLVKNFNYDSLGNLLLKSDAGNYAYSEAGLPRPHGGGVDRRRDGERRVQLRRERQSDRRHRHGPTAVDNGNNSCAGCNSSKGAKDLGSECGFRRIFMKRCGATCNRGEGTAELLACVQLIARRQREEDGCVSGIPGADAGRVLLRTRIPP